jgi:hypothetical protein
LSAEVKGAPLACQNTTHYSDCQGSSTISLAVEKRRAIGLVAPPVLAGLGLARGGLALHLHENVPRARAVRVELFLAEVEVREVLDRAGQKEKARKKARKVSPRKLRA